MSQDIAEQNVGTSMLEHLQGAGQPPEGLDDAQRRSWMREHKDSWTVQPEDLALIRDAVKQLALDKFRARDSTGIRKDADSHAEFDSLRRQAQLVSKIDAKLGTPTDPDILRILADG